MITALVIWFLVIFATIIWSLSEKAKPAVICAWCGKVKSGSIYHGDASHGICDECAEKIERKNGKRPGRNS